MAVDFESVVTRLADTLAPAGTMLPFAGKTVPSGWLLCNGAAVSRTTYSRLFAAIGTSWGTGDGSTTFNLPNCDSRFLEGTTNASKVGTYLEAGLPNITGAFGVIAGNVSGYLYHLRMEGSGATYSYKEASGITPNIHVDSTGESNDYIKLLASRSSGIYGKSSTVQPKSAYTLMIIKV